MKFNLILLFTLFFSSQFILAQHTLGNPNLIEHLNEFSKTSSITGREKQAASYIQDLFQKGELKKDRLGNLIMVLGSGHPKRLITVPLDEPGYVISQIQQDGFIKLNPLGFGYIGNLYHQFIQGHEVIINTETESLIGVSTVRSAHFDGVRANPESMKSPFSWHEIYLDVGATSASELATRNIQLLDPVTLNKKPVTINNSYVAAPSIKSKAAAIALAVVAKSIKEIEFKGTIVFAWTTLELLNGKGIEAVINNYGPFNEIHRFNRFLESKKIGKETLLANNLISKKGSNLVKTKPVIDFRNPASTINFNSENIYEIGLPSLYENSPIELVAVSDVENMIDYWLKVLDINVKEAEVPQLKHETSKTSYDSFNEEHNLVSKLIGKYGVSYDEGSVRKLILNELPNWAKPKIDRVGNIVLTFGKGKEHIAFVAHMDETGYFVNSISDDGRLILKMRGRMFPWIWEAQPALVHTDKNPIQGVFEPRADYRNSLTRLSSEPLKVFAGFNSKNEALAAGIKIGVTTVTMPKEMIRISENRAAARGFDDRVGSAALLKSLKDLNPNELNQRVTFIWSVAEEAGLIGSTFAAKNLTDISTVYPIDTYVSSDDPYSDESFANSPLGDGAVIRVLESINFLSRKNLKKIQTIANKNEIKVQYGMTAGGTDGQAFLGYGIPSIPLSWPGRYSHSPVEVMDYRDLNSLTSLISAIIKNPSNN